MNESQLIKLNRILKKLEDTQRDLKELAYNQGYDPLNSAEQSNVEEALMYVSKAINCL